MPDLHCVLPATPGGVNHLYRYVRAGPTSTRVYKTAAAVGWEQESGLLLRAAGFRPLPAGAYWIGLQLVIHTTRLDIDAPIKLVIDAICGALAVDDRYVGALRVVKLPAKPAEQRVEVCARIEPAADRETFTALSEACILDKNLVHFPSFPTKS